MARDSSPSLACQAPIKYGAGGLSLCMEVEAQQELLSSLVQNAHPLGPVSGLPANVSAWLRAQDELRAVCLRLLYE